VEGVTVVADVGESVVLLEMLARCRRAGCLDTVWLLASDREPTSNQR
jgi:hypothetical protein